MYYHVYMSKHLMKCQFHSKDMRFNHFKIMWRHNWVEFYPKNKSHQVYNYGA